MQGSEVNKVSKESQILEQKVEYLLPKLTCLVKKLESRLRLQWNTEAVMYGAQPLPFYFVG